MAHRQQVSFYNLAKEQVEALKRDERFSCQIQVKTGVLTGMENFDLMLCYVSEITDEIRIGQLESGTLPTQEGEAAVCTAMLRKMGVEPQVGNSVTFPFYDGSTETFTISGILAGSEDAKQFSVFFSQDYAEHGSQLAGQPYKVHAKLHDAAHMSSQDCKNLMYQIGQDLGIERKYVNPSKAFLDSLSPDTQTVMLYGLVGAVILLACILVIYGVFYLSVIGRIHQFGQLRTIGMTRKQMKKMVYREGGLQAQTPMGGEMVAAIYALDGVKKVEQVGHFGVRFDFPQRDEYGNNDMIYPLTVGETQQIGQYLEEGSADYDKLMSGDYVLAAGNDVVREIYGWQFQTGDRITLHYYDGSETAEREVTILGIIDDRFVLEHNGLEGWFLMPGR